MYTVYVLKSLSAEKHYTGFTKNLEERMLSHNSLGKDWSARHRPWVLIFSKKFTEKKDAILYEKWLKTGAGRDFIKSINSTNNNS